MKFSVIVPFLNEDLYLESCIRALLSQKLPHNEYELIFVDNGSTDNSAAIVKSFPDIIYLSEPQKDAYLARNRGIQVAKGEVILFTDADCLVSPEWLELYDKAFQDRSLGIAVGRLNFPAYSSMLVKYYEDYYATKMRMMAMVLPRETCYGHAGNMAVRAKLFIELGLFSPMPIVGDAEIVQKYLARYPQDRICYLEDAAVTHIEVTSAMVLLNKLYRYGIYSQTFSQHSSFRVATMKEKLLTLSECIKEHDYSIVQKAQLIIALLIHYAAFLSGYFRVRIFNEKTNT